jgi:hypothetical protein
MSILTQYMCMFYSLIGEFGLLFTHLVDFHNIHHHDCTFTWLFLYPLSHLLLGCLENFSRQSMPPLVSAQTLWGLKRADGSPFFHQCMLMAYQRIGEAASLFFM